MIEVKNVIKSYKLKGSSPVVALNDVSFKLPNTGMVFIVGKSGSGKSTLLNVLGGLDYVDSGEIIVNGKSTKDFNKREYDSYRNTYVGFVFQEFNIIDSLTVGENIALAIKLQGKKPNKDLIAFILDEVGLDGYMERWPNELSGGQLQRVAIARALVKKPQIIIADEPTGSLDSKTGEQILDTLKMLSRTHLVLVVSHDLEFAERYADRIVEIKDGKKINDIERKTDKKGKKSKFVATNDKKLRVEEDQSLKLIKSRMPIKEATRMGLNALVHKKFKLVASIFLSLVSFTMLGLSSIIGYYNNVDVCSNSFAQFPVIDFAHYEKTLISSNPELEGESGTFSEEDKEILEKSIGVPFTILTESSYSFESNLVPEKIKEGIDIRYISSFYNSTYIPEDKLNGFNIDILEGGRAPTASNEIAITKYAYETFKEYGYYNGTEKFEIDTPEKMLNKEISYEGDTYTITAVYDTHFDNHNSYFDKLWSKHETSTIVNTKGYDEYRDYVKSLAGAMFMSSEVKSGIGLSQSIVGVIKDKSNNRGPISKMYNFAFAKHNTTKLDKETYPSYEYAQYSLVDNITDSALNVIQRATFLQKIFLGFGIAFVVFSGLLLGNFIANSISYQRRDIGILRAIGARTVDIFKIYSVESLVISIANIILSSILSFVVFKFVFGPTLLQTTAGIVLYSFSYIQVLLIFAVSLVSALIATYIPVKLSTRQKPVDAIRLK